MGWLLQKAIASPGESYSPEKIVELLNAHDEAIRSLVYFCTVLLFLWLATMIYAIVINHKLKKIEK